MVGKSPYLKTEKAQPNDEGAWSKDLKPLDAIWVELINFEKAIWRRYIDPISFRMTTKKPQSWRE